MEAIVINAIGLSDVHNAHPAVDIRRCSTLAGEYHGIMLSAQENRSAVIVELCSRCMKFRESEDGIRHVLRSVGTQSQLSDDGVILVPSGHLCAEFERNGCFTAFKRCDRDHLRQNITDLALGRNPFALNAEHIDDAGCPHADHDTMLGNVRISPNCDNMCCIKELQCNFTGNAVPVGLRIR